MQRSDGNENVKKNNSFNKQNKNFTRAAHFFVHFFAVFARTTATWKCLILSYMESVSEQATTNWTWI